MKTPQILLLTSLVSMLITNNVAFAQLLPDSLPVKHFHVGLQTANNRYMIIYPNRQVNAVKLHPLLLTAGVEVMPRLEVQVGYSYWREKSNPVTSSGTTSTGIKTSSYSESRRTVHSAPVSFRYRLTGQAARRVYIDLLFGPSFVKSSYRLESEEKVDDVIVQRGYDSGQALNAFATLGLGARIRFNKHWAAVWDLTASHNLKSAAEYQNREATGNKWGITRAGNLGVHYRFGLR